MNIVLFLFIFLLPIDWFEFSGVIFREAGAKPFNLLAVIWILCICIIRRNVLIIRNRDGLIALGGLLIIILWGGIVFSLNYLFAPEMPELGRSNLVQFITQSGMLVMFGIVLHSQIYLFEHSNVRVNVFRYLPLVSMLHLFFFGIELSGIINPSSPSFLAWFRNENGLIDRASGLMSEPSYFGVFAALYALPLLIFESNSTKTNIFLAILLLISAVIVQGKTMFIVLIAQLIYYFFLSNIARAKKKLLLYFSIVILLVAFYIYLTTPALDLNQNLSSIMRIGSSILAMNVISDGYGLLGIGTGQFHFYYIDRYAPSFLFLSEEALSQMSGTSDGRASTFNFFLRLLLETGILGFLIFFALIYRIFRKHRMSNDVATQLGLGFVAGSIGFLLTQDTYCLPSLAFGIALAITDVKKHSLVKGYF